MAIFPKRYTSGRKTRVCVPHLFLSHKRKILINGEILGSNPCVSGLRIANKPLFCPHPPISTKSLPSSKKLERTIRFVTKPPTFPYRPPVSSSLRDGVFCLLSRLRRNLLPPSRTLKYRYVQKSLPLLEPTSHARSAWWLWIESYAPLAW